MPALINKNNFIAKVLSILGDKMDGDSILLVEQHLPNALVAVCKFVAENKPKGHERLIYQLTLNSDKYHPANYSYEKVIDAPSPSQTDDPFGYFRITDFTMSFVLPQDRFHKVHLTSDLGYVAYPVHTKSSLSMAVPRNTVYYYIQYPYMFIGASAGIIASIDTLTVEHYIYSTFDLFPPELEDLLVQQVVQMIQNEPAKQASEEMQP